VRRGEQPVKTGHWETGSYTCADGSKRVAIAMTFSNDPAPSLWTRFLMRLQGWTWVWE
jgi:hypothetical protein